MTATPVARPANGRRRPPGPRSGHAAGCHSNRTMNGRRRSPRPSRTACARSARRTKTRPAPRQRQPYVAGSFGGACARPPIAGQGALADGAHAEPDAEQDDHKAVDARAPGPARCRSRPSARRNVGISKPARRWPRRTRRRPPPSTDRSGAAAAARAAADLDVSSAMAVAFRYGGRPGGCEPAARRELRGRDAYRRGMPSVSGETLALPASK